MPIKEIYIIIIIVFYSLNAVGQDAPMSQYYSNLVVLNPAFAGTASADRVNFYYRNQWLRSTAGFQTFGASYDKSFKKYNSGMGISLTNEINGAFISPKVDFVYSYMAEILPGFTLSMGLQAGFFQKYLLASELVFQDNTEVVMSGLSKIKPDFALGVVAFLRKYYGGFSINHIAQPTQGVTKTSNERINRKYTFFAGYLHHYNTRLKGQQRVLSPNILVQIQGLQQNINWGLSFQYDKLVGGMWLRHNLHPDFDALIFSVGYKTQSYKFAYSYDMNLGKKTLIPLGAHEISFTMLFETKEKKKFKAIKCPTFLQ